jgi:ATP-dependent helicase HepA
MSPEVAGQRCLSEREPELGLGVVESVDSAARRIGVAFPATGEKRLYALGTGVLKRVRFRPGESITTRDGASFVIASVEEDAGLLTYAGEGRRVREDAISDITSVSLPQERLLAAQADPGEVFNLRLRAQEARARIRRSDVRGFLGGRVELIPHQFYILHEVAARQIPRVLLADEVGLGKTIEACLILQRLLAVGRARRVLVLVPESLVHQWFVELLRRFNLWFSIYDEERCLALEHSEPQQNPFLATQLALCSVGFPAGSESRAEQAVAAGWDLVIVDEAHHLAWRPDHVSPEYALVERLAVRSPGLLLLTATPIQLGLTGHFARLRLLDPNRYSDYVAFVREAEQYGSVAAIADRIVDQRPLRPGDRATLRRIFDRDPERLAQHLEALEQGRPGAREGLLRTLLDQHGTGRVLFRNTRAAMTGFPRRKFCPAPLAATGNPALLARIARELRAEEEDEGRDDRVRLQPDEATADGRGPAEIRYSYKDDPRIDWLVGFLRAHGSAKVLLIGKSQRKVAAIEAALQEKLKVKSALFHEGLPLVQRDRNAAWFAEPDGAQLLLCSEIGSEGRNFQFAHHLVLFDLPLNPGLVEQRIGRLDRIGQTQTIRIHVPFITGSADEAVVGWYHRGLDAFEASLSGGEEYQATFKARLLAVALAQGGAGPRPRAGRKPPGPPAREDLESLIRDTLAFRQTITLALKKGRDRLLELNSFDREVAARVIERIREGDADPFLRNFLMELLDHFGVRIREHEEGDVFLDPSHAYVEGFPSIPPDGMLATFHRQRATAREDIRFVSADHPLVEDAIDLLLESRAGTTAFGTLAAEAPDLLLEAVFVLETVADARWHVDQFLAPTPVRVVVDLRGQDRTAAYDAASVAYGFEDGDLHRFLERPGFNAGVLKQMLETATHCAGERAGALRERAAGAAAGSLGAELQRLVDLKKINANVRAEEIDLVRAQLGHTHRAIEQARLRLDALRLILAGRRERR